MTTIVARIQEVLHGHSARAQIVAQDAEGHVQKLEVPVEAARDLSAEHVLVLTWSAHVLPANTTAAGPEPSVPATSASSPVDTPSSDAATTTPSPGARQLASLIGLKLE